MHNNHRSSVSHVATPRSWLLASAAALALLAALAVLLHPARSNAAQASARATAPLVSTATTSLGRILVDSPATRCTQHHRKRPGATAVSDDPGAQSVRSLAKLAEAN